jgi:hypothetical protein
MRRIAPGHVLLVIDLAATVFPGIEGGLAASGSSLDLFGVMVLSFATNPSINRPPGNQLFQRLIPTPYPTDTRGNLHRVRPLNILASQRGPPERALRPPLRQQRPHLRLIFRTAIQLSSP